MKLVLIRHTTVAASGLCYGRTDVALADSFAREAAAVVAALPEAPWVVYTSPALRCRRLAACFSGPSVRDERLRELDFGAWEGHAWAELPRDQLDPWCADFVQARPPGGESFAELAARARAFVEDVARLHARQNVLAVTHAGVIRAVLALARGLPLAEAWSLAAPYGSIHPIDHPFPEITVPV